MKIIAILLLIAGLSGCSSMPPSVKTAMEGKPLPSFDLLLMDSATHLNTNTIPSGTPFVLFFFSPYCPYCRAETEQVVADMKSLGNIHFYFLSSFPFDPIKQYYNQYQLKKYPNIILGQDYESYFGNYYKANGVPYMAFYDKEKKLKKAFIGNIDTKIIKEIAVE